MEIEISAILLTLFSIKIICGILFDLTFIKFKVRYPAAARASSCCDKNVGSNLIVSEFLEIGLTWSPLNFLNDFFAWSLKLISIIIIHNSEY